MFTLGIKYKSLHNIFVYIARRGFLYTIYDDQATLCLFTFASTNSITNHKHRLCCNLRLR